MPNWCSNILTIEHSGGITKGAEIEEALHGDSSPPYFVEERFRLKTEKYDESGCLIPYTVPLSFHKLIPIPESIYMRDHPDFKKEDKPVYILPENDYWGTKSCPGYTTLKRGPRYVEYEFHTAWSPPIPIAVQISKLFPDATVTIKYLETGNLLGGYKTFKKGELVDKYTCQSTEDIKDFAINEMGEDEELYEEW